MWESLNVELLRCALKTVWDMKLEEFKYRNKNRLHGKQSVTRNLHNGFWYNIIQKIKLSVKLSVLYIGCLNHQHLCILFFV